MKSILLVTAAVALMGATPLPAADRFDDQHARRKLGNQLLSCGFGSAMPRSASFAECDAALTAEAIPFDDVVATYVNRGVLKLVRSDYRPPKPISTGPWRFRRGSRKPG